MAICKKTINNKSLLDFLETDSEILQHLCTRSLDQKPYFDEILSNHCIFVSTRVYCRERVSTCVSVHGISPRPPKQVNITQRANPRVSFRNNASCTCCNNLYVQAQAQVNQIRRLDSRPNLLTAIIDIENWP